MKKIKGEFKKNSEKQGQEPSGLAINPSVRDKDGTGYDIFSRLLKDRIIMVQGQVDTGMAATIIAQIKFLEHSDETLPIKLLINSPGGSVVDGMAILDIMREVKCPIITIGNGMQASMGSILLAGGDQRRMTKNSKVLIHQIMGGAEGGTQHSDFEISARFMADLHETLKSVYVEFTGLNHKFWDKVGERDTWLTADQAKRIGFVQEIIHNEKPDGAYAAEAKRPAADRNIFDKIAFDTIDKMSKEDVVDLLNNGQANTGEWGRYRPELVVRLAEFPEFWTEKRKQEITAKNAAKAPAANDDTQSSSVSSVKKTANDGPKI